ncbi:hypothetical protein BJ912DRAFT_1094062 [Pholiota molesta]|nr:hypothetical protein BJ912DRAFT_1094062 [Pholiota molesta]
MSYQPTHPLYSESVVAIQRAERALRAGTNRGLDQITLTASRGIMLGIGRASPATRIWPPFAEFALHDIQLSTERGDMPLSISGDAFLHLRLNQGNTRIWSFFPQANSITDSKSDEEHVTSDGSYSEEIISDDGSVSESQSLISYRARLRADDANLTAYINNALNHHEVPTFEHDGHDVVEGEDSYDKGRIGDWVNQVKPGAPAPPSSCPAETTLALTDTHSPSPSPSSLLDQSESNTPHFYRNAHSDDPPLSSSVFDSLKPDDISALNYDNQYAVHGYDNEERADNWVNDVEPGIFPAPPSSRPANTPAIDSDIYSPFLPSPSLGHLEDETNSLRAQSTQGDWYPFLHKDEWDAAEHAKNQGELLEHAHSLLLLSHATDNETSSVENSNSNEHLFFNTTGRNTMNDHGESCQELEDDEMMPILRNAQSLPLIHRFDLHALFTTHIPPTSFIIHPSQDIKRSALGRPGQTSFVNGSGPQQTYKNAVHMDDASIALGNPGQGSFVDTTPSTPPDALIDTFDTLRKTQHMLNIALNKDNDARQPADHPMEDLMPLKNSFEPMPISSNTYKSTSESIREPMPQRTTSLAACLLAAEEGAIADYLLDDDEMDSDEPINPLTNDLDLAAPVSTNQHSTFHIHGLNPAIFSYPVNAPAIAHSLNDSGVQRPRAPTPDPRVTNHVFGEFSRQLADALNQSASQLMPAIATSPNPFLHAVDQSEAITPISTTLDLSPNESLDTLQYPLLQTPSSDSPPFLVTPSNSEPSSRSASCSPFILPDLWQVMSLPEPLVESKSYMYDLPPPLPHIIGYGPCVAYDDENSSQLNNLPRYRVFVLDKPEDIDSDHTFAYGDQLLFEPFPIYIPLPLLSEDRLSFPLSDVQHDFLTEVTSLICREDPERDAFFVPEELLLHPLQYMMDRHNGMAHRFLDLEYLLAIAVFWARERHFADSGSESDSMEYDHSDFTNETTSSDGEDLLCSSEYEAFLDELDSSDEFSSRPVSPLEIDLKIPFDNQTEFDIKSEISSSLSLAYPYDSDSFKVEDQNREGSLSHGVMAYGPTYNESTPSSNSLPHTYRATLFLLPKSFDAREAFVYLGSDNMDSVPYPGPARCLPLPIKSSIPLPHAFVNFICEFEQYLLTGRPNEGVEIPSMVLDHRYVTGYDNSGIPHYRFPDAEILLATTVYNIQSNRWQRHLPTPPKNHGNLELDVPSIPFQRVIFPDDEPLDADDNGGPIDYRGGMNRRIDVFRLDRYWQTLGEPINILAANALELALLEARPRGPRLPDKTEINWSTLLYPQSFMDIFPNQTPHELLSSVHAFREHHANPWAFRIHHLLTVRKAISLFLDGINSIFVSMGHSDGLRDYLHVRSLDTTLDFEHSYILQTFEVHYLVAAYEFFVSEMLTERIAHAILNILHLRFYRPDQLSLVVNKICCAINPPNESLSLLESDDELDQDMGMPRI